MVTFTLRDFFYVVHFYADTTCENERTSGCLKILNTKIRKIGVFVFLMKIRKIMTHLHLEEKLKRDSGQVRIILSRLYLFCRCLFPISSGCSTTGKIIGRADELRGNTCQAECVAAS